MISYINYFITRLCCCCFKYKNNYIIVSTNSDEEDNYDYYNEPVETKIYKEKIKGLTSKELEMIFTPVDSLNNSITIKKKINYI